MESPSALSLVCTNKQPLPPSSLSWPRLLPSSAAAPLYCSRLSNSSCFLSLYPWSLFCTPWCLSCPSFLALFKGLPEASLQLGYSEDLTLAVSQGLPGWDRSSMVPRKSGVTTQGTQPHNPCPTTVIPAFLGAFSDTMILQYGGTMGGLIAALRSHPIRLGDQCLGSCEV